MLLLMRRCLRNRMLAPGCHTCGGIRLWNMANNRPQLQSLLPPYHKRGGREERSRVRHFYGFHAGSGRLGRARPSRLTACGIGRSMANWLVENPAGKSNWTLTPPQASTPQRNICMHAGK